MKHRLRKFFEELKHYASRPWYVPLLAFLAAADLFIFVVPTDALVVSAAMLKPKRWFWIGLAIALGSTLGCALLGILIQQYQSQILTFLHIDVAGAGEWSRFRETVEAHGAWAMVLVALGPFPIPPAVVAAAVGGMSITKLTLGVLVGRVVKYLLFAWLGSHTPGLVQRFWGKKPLVSAIRNDESNSPPSA